MTLNQANNCHCHAYKLDVLSCHNGQEVLEPRTGHGSIQWTLVNPVTYVPLLLDRINQRTGSSNSVESGSEWVVP
jgi:hypothetical protein